MKKEDCIFCKIAGGEIPSNTIYENSEFKVIMDIAPASKGHVLIIPKEVEKECIEKAFEKAAGEKKVRSAIEGGMSATEAFKVFGIL